MRELDGGSEEVGGNVQGYALMCEYVGYGVGMLDVHQKNTEASWKSCSKGVESPRVPGMAVDDVVMADEKAISRA